MKDASSGSNGQMERRVEAMAELIKRLCLALTNVEMFAVDHPVARHGIDHAYTWLRQMLDRWHEPVVISVAGATILLDGLPLEERNPLVSKLARRFEEVHINNIFFEPTITQEEFHEFYRLLGRGPKVINAEGGFAEALKKSPIQNIHLKDISYVMVSGDEKVVSKDAQVIEPDEIAGVSTDSDIVKYMVGKLLEKADEQKWLINEIKNNPAKMANMITQGIDLAMSRAELGRDNEAGIGTLINNIRLVGEQLLQEEKDGAGGGQEELERALLALEREMKLRSSKLMSSKVATGFVNEIMSVVTTYADRVRAKQISDEFLKGERSLKQTEDLLRKFAPEEENKEHLLLRLADQLLKRGMSEEDVKKMLDQIKGPEPEPPPAKAAAPTALKPVADLLNEGIEKRLSAAGLKGDKLKQAVKGILPYIEAAAKEKTAEVQKQVQALQVEVEKSAHVLREVPIGVITWQPNGKAAIVNAAARAMLKKEMGIDRSPALAKRLKEWAFPLTDVPDLMKETDLTNDDVNLLLSVAKVMKDKEGEPYGVIMLPLRSAK
jgi:hypothetical protein